MDTIDLSFIEVWVSQLLSAFQVFQGDAQTAADSGAVILGLLAMAVSFLFGLF